ncbi:MAG: hypothetical protein IT441_03540 [Phycisphaeraceae bacterium]|nr:hypothetical protein [Phycisphaeraceae bacterium]
MIQRFLTVPLWATLILILAITGRAGGVLCVWTGPSDATADWSDVSRWSPRLPGSTDEAWFIEGNATLTSGDPTVTFFSLANYDQSTTSFSHYATSLTTTSTVQISDGGIYWMHDSNASLTAAAIHMASSPGAVFRPTFMQLDGSVHILGRGWIDSSTGYSMLGGDFRADDMLEIGSTSSGQFSQFHGEARFNDFLLLGYYYAKGNGNFDLWDGTLHNWSAWVGGAGRGAVEQHGGTHDAEYLTIIDRYEMSGGTLTADYLRVRGGAVGEHRYRQDGGAASLGQLYIGETVAAGQAKLDLDGGDLQALTLFLGYQGHGVMTQTAGEYHSVHGAVLGFAAGSSGTLKLQGGQFRTPAMVVGLNGQGRVELTADAGLHINGQWARFGPQSSLAATPGSAIDLHAADFEMTSSDKSAFKDLSLVRLRMHESRPADPQVEVAGVDGGRALPAFKDNFTLGTLELLPQGQDDVMPASVVLVDESVNGPTPPGSEVLYVKHLILGLDTDLYLNGRKVYYQRLTDLGGTIHLDGGSLIQADIFLGDLNGDGLVNVQDINPFILALTSSPAYEQQFYWLDRVAVGDLSGDGAVNVQDINPFIAALTASSGPGADTSSLMALVPEPVGLGLAPVLLILRRRR